MENNNIKEYVRKENKIKESIEEAKQKGNFKEAYNLTGRLLFKYKKELIKCKKKNPTLLEDSRIENEQKIERLNNMINDCRSELKKTYNEALKTLRKKEDLDENGKFRKKHINYAEKEIKTLSVNQELNDLEKNHLEKLKNEYPKLIEQYKNNLETRTKNNLLKAEQNLTKTVIALPKGCLLNIKKVEACIKDMKNAKTNKEKYSKIINIVKSATGLVATPVTYLTRWSMNSILLITFGISLNKANEKIKGMLEKNNKNSTEIVNETFGDMVATPKAR